MLLLAVLLIVGLLGMHALGGHPAEHSGEHPVAAGVADPASAAEAHMIADAAPQGAVTGPGFVAEPDPVAEPGGDHAAAAGVACVLALLAGILLLIRPEGWRSPQFGAVFAVGPAPASAPVDPPSLHLFCISRT